MKCATTSPYSEIFKSILLMREPPTMDNATTGRRVVLPQLITKNVYFYAVTSTKQNDPQKKLLQWLETI